ncbi:MAG TPA: DNA polymerase IV [Myxococcota bacterium]|nr:DNA polymerase IV [Myxococcota bacterium]
MLLYAEVPGFYAEVERAADPALAERPVIVGGDPRKRGAVQSATPDARAAGVREGMPMLEALERCPRARAVVTNMRRYREAGAELRSQFRRATDRVEPAGTAAAYLDVSERPEAPLAVAELLRSAVRDALALPLRVGISSVKFLAKLAAESIETEGVSQIAASDVRAFLDPLPVGRLPGVGPKTEATLAELGVHTAGDLARQSRAWLEERLGNHGLVILSYAQGRDPATLRAAPHPRSVSQEATFAAPETDRIALEERLAGLAARVEEALAREHLAAKRVVVKIRYADDELTTRSRKVLHAMVSARDLLAQAAPLLDRTQAGTRPVRGLGLIATELARGRRDDRQLDLFGRRA